MNSENPTAKLTPKKVGCLPQKTTTLKNNQNKEVEVVANQLFCQ